jgi:hypothetical protein
MSNKSGFTLSEAMIAGAISVVTIGLAMSYFVEELDVWREQMVVSELNIDLEASMEVFRKDLRLSSVGTDLMSFYPADSNVYTAISFPLAEDDNGDDMLERDGDEKIIWDKTVIYHIRRGTPDELIRTVFDNRKTNSTTAEIYAQLAAVVASDDFSDIQAAAMSGETVTSATIFENLVDLSISPPDVVYDGYNPSLSHYGSFNFGSVVLGSGIHEVTFTCEGKHASSSGYKVGIDLLRMSHSMSAREGELFAVNNKRPASPYFQHAKSAGTVTANDMFGYSPDWSEGAQLTWTPTAVGDTLTLYIKNDLWNDTTFSDPVPQEYDGTVNSWETRFATNTADIGLEERCITADMGTAFDADASADSVSYLSLTNTQYAFGQFVGDPWPGIYYYPGHYDYPVYTMIGDTNANMFYANVRIEGSGSTNEDTVIQRSGQWARFEWTAGDSGYLVYAPWLSQYTNGTYYIGGTNVRFNSGYSYAWVPPNSSIWSDWIADYPIREDSDYNMGFYAFTTYLWPWSTNTSSGTNAMPIYYRADGYMNSFVYRRFYDQTTTYSGSLGFSGIETRANTYSYFLSGIFDTQHTDSDFRLLSWTHYEPFSTGDGDIDMRVRSSANDDMSSPTAWHISSYFQGNNGNNISGLADNRYVQYQAMFTTGNTYTNPGILRDVTIEWNPASEGLVDLRVDFAQGPDYGMVSATVNSQAFVKAVNIDMTIYKDTPRWGRKSVSGSLEVKPLNTDK